jgi:inosose dehydratase
VLERVRHEEIDYSQAVGEGVFTPLGNGVVDFPRLVDTLRRAQYGGWWVLEQDVRLGPPWPPRDPAEDAKHSLSYLRSLLQ